MGANGRKISWECKNYGDLKAHDFHQISYYMNEKVFLQSHYLVFSAPQCFTVSTGHVARQTTSWAVAQGMCPARNADACFTPITIRSA